MAKKEKTAAEIAAEKKANAQAVNDGKQETKATVDPKKVEKMSLDSKVTMARLINDEWLHGNNVSDDIKENAASLRDAYMADAIVTDIAQGYSITSRIIGSDENKYAATKLVLANMGIALPEFKALPQPTAEELKAAGIEALPSEKRIITVEAKDVDKKAVDKKKEELKAAKKAVTTTDPSKIENDEQLHDALVALMTSTINTPDDRIQRAINFYQSYLKIKAGKIVDEAKKNAEIERINAIARIDLLTEITKIVGDCPYIFGGIGKIYRDETAKTGSPIAAFCLHRKAATNNKTGKVAHDDQFIADIVKTIITWTCETVIRGANQTIAEQERAIEKRKDSKDANTHKVAANEIIRQAKLKIADQEKILNIVNNPSFDVVDKLSENYVLDDKEDTNYQLARRLVKNVMDTYHKGVDINTIEQESLLYNCAQQGGIILNLFRGPLAKNVNYSEANLGELKVIEKKEETSEEE